MDFLKNSKLALNKAVKIINDGGVIIFPTDTVYGFLARADSKKAVEKIYKIKKRPRQKPLAVFLKDIKMAKELAEISKEQEKLLKRYWPGKYTFVLKRKKEIKLYGVNKKTVALRIPEFKPLNDLLKKINKPLAQTSVNISGQPSIVKVKEIKEKFIKTGFLMLIDAGDLLKNKPSVIIDLTKDKIKILRK